MTKPNAADNAPNSDTAHPADPGRIVERLGHLIAVAPSLGPAIRGWQKLGFATSEPYDYFDCRAFEIELAGCGVRVVAPKLGGGATAFSRIAEEHLAGAPGLLGWTWACTNVIAAKTRIEEICGRRIASENSAGEILLPPGLTPGATTLLEPARNPAFSAQSNRIDRIDHVVLMVNDSDAVVQAYARGFALKPKSRSMKNARYNFMKVGRDNASVIEVVGPEDPAPGPLGGRAWGVTFATPDFDGCLAAMASEGVRLREPRAAMQGGRITSLSIPFGGIQIAIIGH